MRIETQRLKNKVAKTQGLKRCLSLLLVFVVGLNYKSLFFFWTKSICYHILLNKVSGQGHKQEVQDPQYPKPDNFDLKQQPEQYKIVTGTTMSHSLHLSTHHKLKMIDLALRPTNSPVTFKHHKGKLWKEH